MFNEKIKTLRKQAGLTQEQLAEKLNVSRQAITKWESGEGFPDIDNLKQICKLFNVSMDKITDNIKEEETSLSDKFNFLIGGSVLLGIVIGIVAKDLEIGFIVTVFLPSLMYYIKKLVMDRKYTKEKDIVNGMDNLKEVLPRNIFGKLLNPNMTKEAKYDRYKNYLKEGIIFGIVMTILSIIGFLTQNDNSFIIDITSNNNLNIGISILIELILLIVISFIIDIIFSENIVKRYNKKKK